MREEVDGGGGEEVWMMVGCGGREGEEEGEKERETRDRQRQSGSRSRREGRMSSTR